MSGALEQSNHVSGELVRDYRDRLVHLEEQKRACAEEAATIAKEAERKGLNKRALKELVKRELETDEEKLARNAAAEALDEMQAALESLGFAGEQPG